MAKKFVTTSIAYINAEPHIGFLFELLAADVLARYYRAQGNDVFFLTGTDEHGIKVAKAASEANQEPQLFADGLSAKFEALGQQLGLGWDYFVRTTDPGHVKFVQQKWQELSDKKVLVKKSYAGWYCAGCEAFKTDSEIEEGRCLIHETPVEKSEEQNWFLQIKDQAPAIRAWIEKSVYPATRRQEVINVLESGAYDEVSVSRPRTKNSWGIEVPSDSEQVMYVWVDALLNYLSGIELSGWQIEDWWPADVQLVGKDILKFHAIIWPALLLILGYELPKKLLVHGFINVDGKKMSKSLGNVIAPKDLLDRYGVDGTRYLLLRGLSFAEDSNFSWADFDHLYNGELANGLGNLVARIIGIAKKVDKFDLSLAQPELADRGELDFKATLTQANELINQADGIITAEKLWTEPTTKTPKLLEAIGCLLAATTLLEPFIAQTVAEIRRQLAELDSKPIFPRL